MVSVVHPLSIFRREFLSRTIDALTPRVAIIVAPEATQQQCVELMRNERSGCALVINSSTKLTGIVSERDVLNKWSNAKTDRKSNVTFLMSSNPQTLKSNASIARLVHLMAVGGYRHIPIVYEESEKPKIISSKDFVDGIHRRLASKILGPDNNIELDDNLVDQFFGSSIDVLKPDPALLLDGSKKVSEALALLRDTKRGAIVVVDQKRNITGIFTERDYLMKVALASEDPSKMLLSDLMTPNPKTLPTSASIAIGFKLLSEGGYRHIPLVNAAEEFIGILSVRNFLSYLAASIVATLEKR